MSIPVVRIVRAGVPILTVENIEGFIPLPRYMLNENKEYFALKVKGDSMNLQFKEGTTNVLEKTNVVENGAIGLVLVDNCEATVKKIVQQDNIVTLIPMSTNPDHIPVIYDLEKDDVQIVGRLRHSIATY